jgi:hypothetical protein
VDQKFIKNGFANTKNSDKIEEGREIWFWLKKKNFNNIVLYVRVNRYIGSMQKIVYDFHCYYKMTPS